MAINAQGFDNDMDYEVEINKRKAADPNADVNDLIQQRGLKIELTPGLEKYADSQTALEKKYYVAPPNAGSTVADQTVDKQYIDYTNTVAPNATTQTQEQWGASTGTAVTSPSDRLNTFVIMQTPFGPEKVRASDVGNFAGKDGYNVISTDSAEAMKLGNVGSQEYNDTYSKYGGVISTGGTGTTTGGTTATGTTTGGTGDNAGTISNIYSNLSASSISTLKQRIAESQAAQTNLIAGASQQYQPYKDASEVTKAQELRRALERSANLGDRGGVGRQEALLTQTSGDNRLNSINLQQQNYIDTANSEIARLENEGSYEEATILANNKAAELEALLNEGYRQETIDREDTAIAKADAIRLEESEAAEVTKQKNDFISLLEAGYKSEDYNAAIQLNKNDGDATNDYQIPLLEAYRQQKIGALNLDQDGNPLPVDNTPELTGNVAMALWEQQGTANEAVARALGVEVGTKYTSQYAYSGGGGNVAPTAPGDTPATYYQGLTKLENSLTKYDPNYPSATVRTPMTPQEAIEEIADNEAAYVADYGKDVVNDYVEALNAEINYVEPEPEPIEEAPTVDSINVWYSGTDGYANATDKEAWLSKNAPYMTTGEFDYYRKRIDTELKNKMDGY